MTTAFTTMPCVRAGPRSHTRPHRRSSTLRQAPPATTRAGSPWPHRGCSRRSRRRPRTTVSRPGPARKDSAASGAVRTPSPTPPPLSPPGSRPRRNLPPTSPPPITSPRSPWRNGVRVRAATPHRSEGAHTWWTAPTSWSPRGRRPSAGAEEGRTGPISWSPRGRPASGAGMGGQRLRSPRRPRPKTGSGWDRAFRRRRNRHPLRNPGRPPNRSRGPSLRDPARPSRTISSPYAGWGARPAAGPPGPTCSSRRARPAGGAPTAGGITARPPRPPRYAGPARPGAGVAGAW